MDRLEMMRITEKELGRGATAEQMADFIRERFGENIGAKFIPIIRAGLRGQEALQEARERATLILAEEQRDRTTPHVKRTRKKSETMTSKGAS